MHLRDDVVVVDGRHFLKESGAVDVERSAGEREVGIHCELSASEETTWIAFEGWLK